MKNLKNIKNLKKKIFGIALVVGLLVISIVSTTMAYFTDTDYATHTFTSGKVDIELANDAVIAVSGSIFPGMTIGNKATVTTVAGSESVAGSENAYVGIIVSFNKGLTQTQVNDLFHTIKANEKFAVQNVTDGNGLITKILVAYKNVTNAGDSVDFYNDITVPVKWTSDEAAIMNGLKITVDAYGTQTYGFNDAVSALKAAFVNEWAAMPAPAVTPAN